LKLIMKSFLRSFALYLCSGMYKSCSTGKLLDSLPNCALVNLMWLAALIRRENYQHHHRIHAYTKWPWHVCLVLMGTLIVWTNEFHVMLNGSPAFILHQ
jgi:hypothetical protein